MTFQVNIQFQGCKPSFELGILKEHSFYLLLYGRISFSTPIEFAMQDGCYTWPCKIQFLENEYLIPVCKRSLDFRIGQNIHFTSYCVI